MAAGDPNNIIKIIIAVAIGIIVLIAMRYGFRKFVKKSDKTHMRFLGNFLNLIVIIILIVWVVELVDPTLNISSIFLKGSAIIVAIVGFAAQAAISDIICGFLISVNKPFEIGDRIIVEGKDPGIVEDITLRHTVIRIYDDHRLIIPNSELNSKTVINTSFHNEKRGIHLKYSVSYDTDLNLARELIRDCVAASPYTLGVETNGIKEDSGPVYFLTFGDSALVLETTIWVTRQTNSYVAITDVNMRVNQAFRDHGIEIPYNFLNIVEREAPSDDGDIKKRKKTAPSKRNVRTDTVNVSADGLSIEEAMGIVRGFATRQRLTDRATKQLELMAEEVIGIMGSIVNDTQARFWVDGTGHKFRIHLRFDAKIGSEEYKKLLALSTSGKNEAVTTLAQKLWETMIKGINNTDDTGASKDNFEWSINDAAEEESDNISESILMALADDIKVSVTKETVDLIVIKNVKL